MPFQTTVAYNAGFGVPGELFRDGPFRGNSLIIESGDAALNVIGNAFTIVSEGKAEAGGDGIFAGILGCPKQYASRGTVLGGPLAPTLTLANNEQADFITVGEVNVYFNNAFTVGQGVYFDSRTGEIFAGTAGGGYQNQITGAYVSHFTSNVAGLGVVTLNTQQS